MSYPEIDNALDLAAALRGAKATDALLRLINQTKIAAGDAAVLDPSLISALLDFCNGLHDLLGDLAVTLRARDEAIAAYEHDCAGVEWAPEMMRGTQAGRTP